MKSIKNTGYLICWMGVIILISFFLVACGNPEAHVEFQDIISDPTIESIQAAIEEEIQEMVDQENYEEAEELARNAQEKFEQTSIIATIMLKEESGVCEAKNVTITFNRITFDFGTIEAGKEKSISKTLIVKDIIDAEEGGSIDFETGNCEGLENERPLEGNS